MQLLKRHWIIAIGVVVAIALFAAFAFKGNDKPQYFTTKADRGDIRAVVEATGTINAVITVQVGSQVSGTISHLYADFNSRVKKGQVVAQIDPALFEGALLQAKADLANAEANLAAAKANVEKAKATARQAEPFGGLIDTAAFNSRVRVIGMSANSARPFRVLRGSVWMSSNLTIR